MKVRNLINTESIGRGPVVAVLIMALAFAGAVAPIAAQAESAPASSDTQSATIVPATVATGTPVATETTPAVEATPLVAPAPVSIPAPAKKLTVKQIIAKVGHDAGLSSSEVAGLLWIAHRESNYHPTSKSSSGCYGLFQLSKGMAGGHPWKDPYWNTKRAIKYMKGRYHGVLKAKAFWLRHHWY